MKITNELIEKARRAAPGDDATELAVMVHRLADALEAATRERDAVLAVLERIRRAVAGHPKCDRYEGDDAVSCGWKSAYASVVWALEGEKHE